MASLILDYRVIRKFSQEEISQRLGYGSSQFISNIERGQSLLPVKKFKKLAKILDLDIYLIVDAYIADVKESVKQELLKR